jgi:hypothetical protein
VSHKLNFFLSTALVAVSLLTPEPTHGMDEASSSSVGQPKPSGMQLSQGANDTLEAVLGTGHNVLLRLSMDVSSFKKPIDNSQLQKGKLELPFRLYLTDFVGAPTAHPAVRLTATVDVESTLPTYTLPPKPSSFESYGQFTQWLRGAYFTNHVNMTYDFQVDVQNSAPSLAQLLFAVMPGYRFIGTYAIDNAKVKPDKCVPQVTYVSKRGTENKTMATLSGTLYLADQAYPVESIEQVFPHPILDQVVFKKDETRRFYSHKWVARSEATAKVTYEEFPKRLIQNWPKVPTATYSILKKTPNDFEDIKHLDCWDGASGDEVDISDGRVFSMDCEAINALEQNGKFTESIVKDDLGNLYTVHYVPINPKPPVPLVARGHEEVYFRFFNGALIYRPNPNSDAGMVTLPIRELANPLEGTFDLSRCGDTGNRLIISTGYRKGQKPENASKVEIRAVLRFLVEKEINTTAAHLYETYMTWHPQNHVGLFWNYGSVSMFAYDYLTSESMDNLSKINLYENWSVATGVQIWSGFDKRKSEPDRRRQGRVVWRDNCGNQYTPGIPDLHMVSQLQSLTKLFMFIW